MSDEVVIPFRKRPPSEVELEVFRRITRGWHPEVRRLLFPEHSKHSKPEYEPAGK